MGFLKRMVTGPDKVGLDQQIFTDPNLEANQRKLGALESSIQNRPATQINTAPQDQFRQGQTGLVQALQDQVAGTAPSAAETQLRQGQEASLKQALAVAGSQRGGGVASNQRTLARNVMDNGQTVNAQAATLRAGEQATAAGTLGSVLGGARAQDIGLATSQAQLTAQQRAQQDQLVQQYMQLGLTLDQAQFKARQDMASLQAQISLGNSQAQQKADAGMLSSFGSLAAAGLTSGAGGGGGGGTAMAGNLTSLAALA